MKEGNREGKMQKFKNAEIEKLKNVKFKNVEYTVIQCLKRGI